MVRKTILVADSKSKTLKVLGIKANVDLSKVKILINGIDITPLIKLADLKIVEDE